MPKNNKIKLPPIDGSPEPGRYYYTINTINPDQSLATKQEVRELYIKRFGEDPDAVFYGRPKGSLIYAGPVGGAK
jgi:hypothetical protein